MMISADALGNKERQRHGCPKYVFVLLPVFFTGLRKVRQPLPRCTSSGGVPALRELGVGGGNNKENASPNTDTDNLLKLAVSPVSIPSAALEIVPTSPLSPKLA